jgi:hypothetical protein
MFARKRMPLQKEREPRILNTKIEAVCFFAASLEAEGICHEV